MYKSINSNVALHVLVISIIIGLSGLIEITPVGTSIRFAPASILLMLVVLIFNKVPLLLTGIFTSIFILTFRLTRNLFFLEPGLNYFGYFIEEFPGAFYYFLLCFFIWIFNIRQYQKVPYLMGGLLVLSDVFANVVELLIRYGLDVNVLSFRALGILLGVSLVRVAWVIGIAGLVWVSQQRTKHEQERIRLDELTLLTSGLYTEAFLLKKDVKNIENVMARGYKIYRDLKKDSPYAEMILDVTRQVHDVKKDIKRTLSGLEKVIKDENHYSVLTANELIDMVIRSNIYYAQNLEKKVRFINQCKVDMIIYKVYPMVSILNNLVGNSLEAIEKEGVIEIGAKLGKDSENDNNGEDFVWFWVCDSGKGILDNHENLIFDPGYTTKYTNEGNAAGGIGLTQVEILTKELEGNIKVESKASYEDGTGLGGACFIVLIPAQNLMKEG
ncbi:sensor histidine kinase [Natranaerofaba carboxydovora]|uniref:sensor histidine kinase n=1 Tax=Natranaerofaba carboxydovora TaxID=2742683 RepID=UPI001F144342|nr:ATP-binding protein [Natranaerofaba carboxydovora]UMZ72788.1 Sensor histidine kinase GlnK [Natranaerofaba carboxydovora]